MKYNRLLFVFLLAASLVCGAGCEVQKTSNDAENNASKDVANSNSVSDSVTVAKIENQSKNESNTESKSVDPEALVARIPLGAYSDGESYFHGKIRCFLECYPCEFQFGDPVYFGYVVQNVSDSVVKCKFPSYCSTNVWSHFRQDLARRTNAPKKLFQDLASMECKVMNPDFTDEEAVKEEEDWPFPTPDSYQNFWESEALFVDDVEYMENPMDNVCAIQPPMKTIRMQPGQKVVLYVACACFPPLQDWKYSAFWNKVKKDLEKRNVLISVKVTLPDMQIPSDYLRVDRYFFLGIKARKPSEMAQIDRWFETTPPEFFPKKQGPNDFFWKPTHEVVDSWPTRLYVRGIPYLPFSFMRQRMPFGTEMPETMEEWQALEDSWSAGSMRDEMKMTRLSVELFERCTVQDRRTKRSCFNEIQKLDAAQEIQRWWESLPDVQSAYYKRHTQGFAPRMEMTAEDSAKYENHDERLMIHYLKGCVQNIPLLQEE